MEDFLMTIVISTFLATFVICGVQWNLAAKRFEKNRFKFTVRGLVFAVSGFFAYNFINQNFLQPYWLGQSMRSGVDPETELITLGTLGFVCMFGLSTIGLFFAKRQWKAETALDENSEMDEIGNP